VQPLTQLTPSQFTKDMGRTKEYYNSHCIDKIEIQLQVQLFMLQNCS
jgi:hypothetical protein